MTDDKNKIKKDYADIVKKDIDALFDRELSDQEVDSAIVGEIGAVLDEMTTMNNISADLAEDDSQSVSKIKNTEMNVVDLQRMVEIKEELDQAA